MTDWLTLNLKARDASASKKFLGPPSVKRRGPRRPKNYVFHGRDSYSRKNTSLVFFKKPMSIVQIKRVNESKWEFQTDPEIYNRLNVSSCFFCTIFIFISRTTIAYFHLLYLPFIIVTESPHSGQSTINNGFNRLYNVYPSRRIALFVGWCRLIWERVHCAFNRCSPG